MLKTLKTTETHTL